MIYMLVGLPDCDRLTPRSRVWNNADQQPEFGMRSLTESVDTDKTNRASELTSSDQLYHVQRDRPA
jgi:hypothetical protein